MYKIIEKDSVFKKLYCVFVANANAAKKALANLNANQNDYSNVNQNGKINFWNTKKIMWKCQS